MVQLPPTSERFRYGGVRGLGAWVAAVACAVAFSTSLRSEGMEPWLPVDAAQLAQKAPPASDPDAPAEVLDWKVVVDDSERPSQSTVHEYIRYKIYDPEKSTGLTRVSQSNFSFGGTDILESDMRARLIKPDGTIKEYGKESIQERDLERNGREKTWITRLLGSSGAERKEKFLATGGIETGSILEFQFVRTQHYPGLFFTLVMQRDGIPVRRMRLEQVLADANRLTPLPVLLNATGLDVKELADEKKKALVIIAQNLPGYVDEAFQPPLFNRALTYFGGYRWRNLNLVTNRPFTPRHLSGNAGPWEGYATKAFIFERDVTLQTRGIKKLADGLVEGAASDQEKALRIYRFVQRRFQDFQKSKRTAIYSNNVPMAMAEDTAEFEKYPDEYMVPLNFLYLSIALFRAAGLESQVILLPDNSRVFFSPKMDSEAFIEDACARVRIAGEWVFAKPQTPSPVPLGVLPHENAGGFGLVVQDSKEEFIDVPESPAGDSKAANTGSLELGEDGDLNGSCKRTLTGQVALNLRRHLHGLKAEEINRRLERNLKEEFKADSVEITSVEGLDDAEAPLVIDYSLHVNDYAEVTKDRIIFRANVFHGQTTSPFAADTRHNTIVFPYKWGEDDDFNLQLPEGYVFESPSMPPSQPGPVLSYTISIARAKNRNRLYVKRSFLCNAEEFKASAYGQVKKWFDSMAQSDGHELVLVKEPSAIPEKAPEK